MMIQDMEAEAQRRSMKCHSIKDLVQMIPSYALRWPVVLESIIKKAQKEPYKKKVEQSAKRAHNTMTAIFRHMEQVTTDYMYGQAMDRYKDEVNNLPLEFDLTRLGKLMKELQGVDLQQGTTGSDFHKCDLLIFEECILVLSLETKYEYVPSTFPGNFKRIMLPSEGRTLKHTIKIQTLDEIRLNNVGKDALIYMYKYTNLQKDEKKSFVLKVSKNIGMKITEEL